MILDFLKSGKNISYFVFSKFCYYYLERPVLPRITASFAPLALLVLSYYAQMFP